MFDAALSRSAALARLRRILKEAGTDNPALDARVLLISALAIDPTDLLTRPEHPIGSDGAAKLTDFARRRVAREPVSRILGTREFWGLPFALAPETLVPRPDTETVVAAALRRIANRTAPLRILDLGTGSGCIIVALLHELPHAIGVGVDRSATALATARLNAVTNAVSDRALFAASDWGSALRSQFDIIVSNPPYIASGEIPSLDPEVRHHDPALALDGGPDGLDAYRQIFADVDRLLSPGGMTVVEIGFDQENDLKTLAADYGLTVVEVAQDLAGHPRAVILERSVQQEHLAKLGSDTI